MKRLTTAERGEMIVKMRDMEVPAAREIAESEYDWKYKEGKSGKSPDEKFADWFASQRQRFICDLVKDKLIQSGEFADEDQFDEARKNSDASSEFYFLRDNLEQKELLKTAEDVTPDIKSAAAQKKEDLASALEKLGIRL